MSCGRPCPGIDVQVADESGKEVETGQRSELIARGANVMRGYWNNQKDTAAAFRNGFFRTGDIGYQDADGYFYILDRLKDMIVTGGENVYSGEVEAVISDHPAVREVAVFGIPDPQWGELVAACVVLKQGLFITARRLDPPLSSKPGELQGPTSCGILGNGFTGKRIGQSAEAGLA
ncbi:MAG: long-chain acyl-CoA synthetase [Blastocatellia bacterium]|jgi:long-chain acyl-CoA synthetase|nr:long-chain acyl-CoA synthetase [Blastocatellia bacterium]